MICDREAPVSDAWGHPVENDPRCEFCERSVIARFGGWPSNECPSCAADFARPGWVDVAPGEPGYEEAINEEEAA